MPPSSEVELPVLEALAAEPSLSQRELAQRAGLSLTKAHFVLKRLVERGLVKVRNAAQSEHKLGYLYLLTPQGMEEKARLTYAFLQRTASEYRGMVARVEDALQRGLADVGYVGANAHGPLGVAIVGEGPLAEVVRDIVALREDVVLVDQIEHAVVAVDVAGASFDGPAAGLVVPASVKLMRLA